MSCPGRWGEATPGPDSGRPHSSQASGGLRETKHQTKLLVREKKAGPAGGTKEPNQESCCLGGFLTSGAAEPWTPTRISALV